MTLLYLYKWNNPKALGLLCPCIVRIWEMVWHPVKWAACSLGMVLGMMISAIKISVHDDWGLFKDELEIRFPIHEIIPHRRRQGVLWMKIIVVNVLDIGFWQAHAEDSNLAFTNQFLLQTMLPLLSRSIRDGCKDRPNDWYHDSLLVSGDRPSLLR